MNNDPHTALRHAVEMHRNGRIAQAETLYRQLVPLLPAHPDLPFLIGTACLQQGRCAEAIEWLQQAIERKPDRVEAMCNLGVALKELGRLDESLAVLDRGIATIPQNASLHLNRGSVLNALHRHAEALESLDQAVALNPNNPESHNNRGAQLRDMRRYDEALAAYDRALALRADFVEAHNNRGNVLKSLGRTDEAMASFDRALALRPGHVSAQWNKSLVALLTGDFATGWPLYERRWQRMALRHHVRSFAQPRWNGEALDGKTILIYHEQGLGDCVQFVRYAPLLWARGARVVIDAQKPLVPLLQTLPGECDIIAAGDPLPDFDFHIPIMSLPLAFATTLETIPAETPYLFSDPARRKAWRKILGKKKRPRIGLVWAGKSTYQQDDLRSLALAQVAPLFEAPFDFHALHKDIPEDDTALFESGPLADHRAGLHDFADTAALIDELDLVISVDTSVAHVAGSLGKPVWVLLPFMPDWRWLLGRTDSPWYPSARLFRQPSPGDWASVIASVARELETATFGK